MKEIDIKKLTPGATTDREYYSASGELLISRDVTLTDKHLQLLTRRNIFKVYVQESESERISRIMERDYSVGDIDFEEESVEASSKYDEYVREPPKIMEFSEFKKIQTGEQGLRQLAESTKITEIDKKLQREVRGMDTPKGAPLEQMMIELMPEDRDDTYKEEVSSSYYRAREKVEHVINELLDGRTVDGSAVREIVESFFDTFLNDKNILINISGVKHTHGTYVFSHSLNTCLLAMNIAAAMKYSEEQVKEIGIGALLHDIGMLLIPYEIREKKGRLTHQEWFEVMKHPMLGLHVLENITRLPRSVPFIAYQTHERVNAKGYPKQRHSRLIHRYAKIVQTAEIFDALCSPRSYRTEYIPYKAMEMVVRMPRLGLLGPGETRSFLRYVSLFPVGSLVELNDGRIAKVIKSNDSSFTKPVVSVLTDVHGDALAKEKIYQLDLSQYNNEIRVERAHRHGFVQGCRIMDGF